MPDPNETTVGGSGKAQSWTGFIQRLIKVGVIIGAAFIFMYMGANQFDDEMYTWAAIALVVIVAEALGVRPLETIKGLFVSMSGIGRK